jgi:V/A-type H+-transporting ATPase subunit I
MTGLSLIGPRDEIHQVARKLLSKENFEPAPIEVMLGNRPVRSRVKVFRENPYDAPLEKIKRLWFSAGIELPSGMKGEKAPNISIEEAAKFADQLDMKMSEWDAWAEQVRDERAGVQALIMVAEAIAEKGMEFERLRRARELCFSVGPLLAENWERFQEVCKTAPIFVFPLIQGDKRVVVLALYSRNYLGEAKQIFDAVHFQEYQIEHFGGDFRSLQEMRDRFLTLDRARRDYQHAPTRYIEENRTVVERHYFAVSAMQRIYELGQLRGEIAGMMVITGWIPTSSLDDVKAMAEASGSNILLLSEPGEAFVRRGNKIPTLLKNTPFARYFQEIVRLYSLPSYGEYDPTPIVAVSFCLFFGMMFGDVGHGLALSAGAWLLYKRRILPAVYERILIIAGFSSAIFGLLYGSVFGDESVIHALWLSPMEDVNTLIAISVFIGAMFLTLGSCLRLLSYYRRQEWGQFFFSIEGVAGLLFYWLAGLLLVLNFINGTSIWITLLQWLVGIALFTLLTTFFLSNVFSKKLFGHAEEGGMVHVFTILDALISFISNTASFVRLAAFAMNHAGLSMATFMIYDMVHSTPGGRFTSLLVLLLGNLLIIGLEGLIVFIQTLRLEYYEFFSKFLTGGGRPFAPVAWKRR